jgi:LacI family transcriptional regulator
MRELRKILVMLPRTGYPARGVLMGFAKFAQRQSDWHLFLMDSPNPERFANLGNQNVDGVVGWVHNLAQLPLYQQFSFPVVNCVSPLAYGLPSVIPDDAEIGRQAAQHMMDLGIRQFGYFGPGGDRGGVPDRSRRLGFVRTIQEAGCGVLELQAEPWIQPTYLQHARKLGQWLTELSKPCGILGFDDNYGRMVVNTAQEYGISVPEELAVIGVNDDDVQCECCRPSLTSIDMNAERIGYEAGMVLKNLIEGGKPPEQPIRVAPRGIIERGSTEMLAIEDPELVQAIRYIREHAVEGIRVSDVVKHTQLSRRNLEMKFQKQLQRTPLQEIRRVRLQRATRYLRDTDWTLSQIAMETGFAGIAHLSRQIKAATGLTPTDYRRQRRELPRSWKR